MENKTIVAVFGPSNKGKSSTLKALGRKLIEENPNAKVLLPIPENHPEHWDFILVIEINGVRIGIVTQGDPKTGLKDKLKRLAEEFKCDLIFCSTRTKHQTVWDVEWISNNLNYHVIWTSTYQMNTGNNNKVDVNTIKARHLLELVKELGLMN